MGTFSKPLAKDCDIGYSEMKREMKVQGISTS